MAEEKTPRYLIAIGLGFYWAWVTLVFYSDILLPNAGVTAPAIGDIWLMSTTIHMVTLLFCVIFAIQTTNLLSRRPIRLLFVGAMSIGTFLIFLGNILFGTSGELVSIVSIIGTAISAVFSAGVLLMWGLLFSRLNAKDILLLSFLGFGIGLMLYFLVSLIIMPIDALLVSLFPFLSGVLLESALKPSKDFSGFNTMCNDTAAQTHLHNHKIPLAQDELMRESVAYLFVIFIYALCGEILRAFSIDLASASISEMGSIYLLGGLIGIAVFFATVLQATHKHGKSSITLAMVRNVLIVMAAGFLVVPFLGGVSFAVSYGIFGAGFWCFRIITWVICFMLISRLELSPIRVVGLLDVAFAFSVVVSSPINNSLLNSIQIGQTQVSTIAILMVFILMCIVIFVSNDKILRMALAVPADSSVASGADDASFSAKALSAAFVRYRLSSREMDVALLLARGRSLPFIQDELYISEGTVRTHVRHIYQKLDVHDRQEFLSLVERLGAVQPDESSASDDADNLFH